MPIKAYVTLKASITSVFPSGKGTNKKNRRFSGISWRSSISQSPSNESVVKPKNRDIELDRHQGHCIRAHTCPTTTGPCAYSSSPILVSDTIDNKMPLSGYDSHPFHQSSLSRQSVSVPSLGSLNLPMESALMTVSQVDQDDHFPSFVYLDSGHPPPIQIILPMPTTARIRIGMVIGTVLTIVLRAPKMDVTIMNVNQRTDTSLMDICWLILGQRTSWCKDRHQRLFRRFLEAITLPSRVRSPEEDRDGECAMQWSRHFYIKVSISDSISLFNVTCKT